MELVPVTSMVAIPEEIEIITPVVSTDKPFILANTQEMDFHSLQRIMKPLSLIINLLRQFWKQLISFIKARQY
jgi:hypothetical protein